MSKPSVSESVLTALGWSQTSQLIQEITGIQVPSRDQLALQRHIQSRMQRLGLEHESQFCDRLKQSYRHCDDQEWTELLHLVTNGESYFFRDEAQLNLISDTLLPELIDKRRKAFRDGYSDHLFLNLWSAGCSTGEEPYSLAMLLKETLLDFSDWRIHLIATDINPQSLQSARAGRYRDWAFRQTGARYKSQYFRRVGKDWQIDPDVQRLIQWDVLNLTQPNAIARRIPWASMDLILCRNVFIYFDPAAIARTLKSFHESLNSEGYLIVGHAELEGQDLRQFNPMHSQSSIIYQKKLT